MQITKKHMKIRDAKSLKLAHMFSTMHKYYFCRLNPTFEFIMWNRSRFIDKKKKHENRKVIIIYFTVQEFQILVYRKMSLWVWFATPTWSSNARNAFSFSIEKSLLLDRSKTLHHATPCHKNIQTDFKNRTMLADFFRLQVWKSISTWFNGQLVMRICCRRINFIHKLCESVSVKNTKWCWPQ